MNDNTAAKKRSHSKSVSVSLSKDGARRALNYIRDVAQNRRKAATFFWDDKNGVVRELGSDKAIDVTYNKR